MKGFRGERKKRDPCLTVEEARELVEWLDDLARTYSETGIGPGMPDLIEPNLRILVLKTSPLEVQLRVEFIFESKGAPPVFDHVDLVMKKTRPRTRSFRLQERARKISLATFSCR
jgi:hypothetical protein